MSDDPSRPDETAPVPPDAPAALHACGSDSTVPLPGNTEPPVRLRPSLDPQRDDNVARPAARPAAPRLELFVPACHAGQPSHQKGVIHRDLKPGNILVTMFDGKPVPKVIDFGIAKATSFALTDLTLFTQVGSMIGTIEYMSPEQAMTSGLDVDTRTDIYSLGVILYELISGPLPFDPKALR